MYTLTLTKSERDAIDFVGDRYATGEQLYNQLWVRSKCTTDSYWEDDCDLTFQIAEHVAWRIRELAEMENNLWPLFSPNFAQKMSQFVDSIV